MIAGRRGKPSRIHTAAGGTREVDAQRQERASPARGSWPLRLILPSYLLPVVALFGSFLFSNAMLYGSDMVPMGYMARKLYKTMWTQFHEFPLWNPHAGCGEPHASNDQSSVFFPPKILSLLLGPGYGLFLFEP